ncbi:MAG: hypothetical protein PHE24_02005 [Patescibacteria group bacterium]|nr:hypothetical protein [Patescibacteria group bacterium]
MQCQRKPTIIITKAAVTRGYPEKIGDIFIELFKAKLIELPVNKSVPRSFDSNPENPLLFVKSISNLVALVVKNGEEAEIAADLICGKLTFEEIKERDDDHHSHTFREEILIAYSILTGEAFKLANDQDELRRLIDEKIKASVR